MRKATIRDRIHRMLDESGMPVTTALATDALFAHRRSVETTLAILAAAGFVRRVRLTESRAKLYWQSTRHPIRDGFFECRKNSDRVESDDVDAISRCEQVWRGLMGAARFSDVATKPGTLRRLVAPPSRSMIGNAADLCTRV